MRWRRRPAKASRSPRRATTIASTHSAHAAAPASAISAERACALFEEVTGAGETEPRLSSTNRETPIVFDEFVRFFAALAEVVFVNAAPTVPARARHMFAFLIVATRLAGGPSDPKWGC